MRTFCDLVSLGLHGFGMLVGMFIAFRVLWPVLAGLGLPIPVLPPDVAPLERSLSEAWLKPFLVIYSLIVSLLLAWPQIAEPIFGVLARITSPCRPVTWDQFVRNQREWRNLEGQQADARQVLRAFRIRARNIYGVPSVSVGMNEIVTQSLAIEGLVCWLLAPFVVAYLAQETWAGAGSLALAAAVNVVLLYYVAYSYSVFFRWLLVALIRLRGSARGVLPLAFSVQTTVFIVTGLWFGLL